MPVPHFPGKLYDRFTGVRPRDDSLDRLSKDVLVEILSYYLDLFDILRMRQVSRLYHNLTHHAIVWKRLLRRIDMPLPPVPPTSRHTPDCMTGLEIERLICRAYSLHINWERHYPRCLHAWSLEAFHKVHEMVLLPGGRYIVASVSDPKGLRHALMVYALDAMGCSRPIAKTDMPTKVFAIRAKYVTIKGDKSIAIAYLRRDYHHKTDKRKAYQGNLPSASEYSTYHPVDADIRFRHECVALHARLSTLEALADLPWGFDNAQFIAQAQQLPPPFENLVQVVSRPEHRLMCPDIEEMFDSAYLSVVKGPNDIIFKRLDGGPPTTLTCLPDPAYAQFVSAISDDTR
ncbi:hypothetical protein C8Q77DRAFT_1068627 [Trametes polyzona]|nr:hypothetical protein C8Q77DRAFT_1068627 [Trametes polyzona]